MNDAPIGIFDSGLGGLSCLPAIRKALPDENIIYFGDTARIPYGGRPLSEIKKFSLEAAEFLVSEGVKAIAIACNTVSAAALFDISEKYPNIPITGIIEPAVKMLLERKKIGKTGLIATELTVKSKAYEKAFAKFGSKPELPMAACPLFVPIVEEGLEKSEIAKAAVRFYLDKFINENKIENLILGCTHYPFLAAAIEEIYPDLTLIDPADALAKEVAKMLKKGNKRRTPAEGALLKEKETRPYIRVYASLLTKAFGGAALRAAGGADYIIEEKALTPCK